MKTIIRLWPPLAAFLALSALTCHPQNRFSINDRTADASISAEGTTNQLDFTDFDDFSIAKDAALTSQGISLEELTSVKVTNFNLLVANPASGQDLTFITNVSVYASAPGQPQVLIASRASFDAGSNDQSLTVADVELVDYFNQDAVTIQATATVKTPSNPIVVRAHPVLQILVSAAQPVCN